MAKKSLKETVYDAILQSIIDGEYGAGHILNEQTLISHFGYSKSPIREALIMLCNEGVLKNIPRYGYEVVRFTYNDIKEIMMYRRILEYGLLKSCFDRITPQQLAQLKKLQSEIQPNSAGTAQRWENNQEFHMVLASFAENTYATQQLQSTMMLLRIAYAQKNWELLENRAVKEDPHDVIIRGIETGYLAMAEEALVRDLSIFTTVFQD
ncbi:MAG: GntR family transcriptional regulator [Firmicutes bacterium]|nr:GntR family transcriptional regulator [Bacillota bacterium]